jgi:demethylmenaquinone methyltransferase/2-methoxy-6-polyprenyl-1,4-benzoquinol methylase
VWDRDALRDPHGQPDKAARVEAMFDAIAPTYELVNTLGSLGRDAAWRRRAVAAAGAGAGEIVLDICCGTGDMLRALAQATPPPALLVGVDFAGQMLARANFAAVRVPVHVIRADALRLPLADDTVDAVTCAFGVRNFADVPRGLAEMHRVTRPGGRVVILEFALPEHPVWRVFHRLYVGRFLPLLAAMVNRDRIGAYRYLARSIRMFEPARELARRLEAAGFRQVTWRTMNFGGVVLYRGVKPPTDAG